MSKQRKEAQLKVAQQLFATESAIDGAIATAAQFVGLMPVARQEARFSAVVGQKALDRAVAAVAALTEARRAIVEAHNALAEVQGQMGMQPVNFGALIDKPEYPPSESGYLAPQPALRAVPSLAA
jgi:hypothetical protein